MPFFTECDEDGNLRSWLVIAALNPGYCEVRSAANCEWVRGKVAERGWTEQIEVLSLRRFDFALARLREPR
jgi:hypothetical protein